MPTIKSQIKTILEEKLKEANKLLLQYPNEKSALKYVNAIIEINDVCEKRGRY